MRKLVVLFTVLFAFCCHAAVKLKVSPHHPEVNDVIALTFEIDGQQNQSPPDFSPLEKDFEILSTAKSSNVSIINQVVKAQTLWRVNVIPKRSGEIVVPSIRFGRDVTATQALLISGKKSTHTVGNKKAFMETSISHKDAYVQEGLVYKIKLFYKNNLASGRLTSPPVSSHARLVKLGEVNEYQTSINGNIYQVSEQQYAIFPEKSGSITIDSPVFQGSMRSDNYSQMSRLLMDVARPVRLKGESIKVNVKSIPKSYPQDATWLPATSFEIKEHWQGDKNAQIGKPVTRTITLSATGLDTSQLPELDFTETDGIKIYPAKVTSHNNFSHGRIASKKTIRVTYIPTQDGKLNVPAIHIPWWDVKNNQVKYASLKSKTVLLPKQQHKTISSPLAMKDKAGATLIKVPSSEASLLPWVLVAALSLSWLIFIARRFFAKKDSSRSKIMSSQKRHIGVKEALKSQDKNRIQEAIIDEAREIYQKPDILNLGDIQLLCQSPLLKDLLSDLEASLYGEKSQWCADELLNLLREERAKQKKKSHKNDFDLPAFNP